MKKVSGTMRLDLAQYRDLEAFASFGSELDQASQNQLDRGERTVEVLKQPQYAPVPVEEQVIVVWAVTNGSLDDIPVEDVQTFNERLREHVRSRHTDLLEHLRTEGTLGDDVAEQIADAVDGFKRSFSSDDDEDFDFDHGADEDLAELGDDVERAHGEAQDDPATGTSDAEVGRDDDDDVEEEEVEATDAFEDDDATGEVADTSDDGTADDDTADRDDDVVDEDPAQDTTDEIIADGDDDNR
jgi:hypothetical protein